MIPRKHAFEIMAWANGAEIEYKVHNGGWVALEHPSWDDHNEFRIKPKQPVVRWLWAKQVLGNWQISPVFRSKEEALKTFNGEFICLEYTRTEFPE